MADGVQSMSAARIAVSKVNNVSMLHAKKLTIEKTPDFSAHSVNLTSEEMDTLQRVSQDMTDSLGRLIGVSAVVRALIRQVVKRGSWAMDTLLLEIEGERQTDMMWKKKKKN
jgi:hypothetical protein